MVKNKKDEVKNEEIAVEAPKKYTHRYFCDACTGVAFLHSKDEDLPKSAICKSCGATLTVKPENLIKL